MWARWRRIYMKRRGRRVIAHQLQYEFDDVNRFNPAAHFASNTCFLYFLDKTHFLLLGLSGQFFSISNLPRRHLGQYISLCCCFVVQRFCSSEYICAHRLFKCQGALFFLVILFALFLLLFVILRLLPHLFPVVELYYNMAWFATATFPQK